MTVTIDPRIGTELLGYRIEALVGRGGMSVVYRAEDLRLKRKVALKLLAPELAQDERFRERFLRESELAASLDHPHIVPIYEAGEHAGQLWIAMRYVEGSDLKKLLKEEGALEPKRALAYLEDLADALDAAHARGLVHRDVKPSNALIDGSGHLYLSDFGLTKSASDRSAMTLTGRIVGTVDYAAPEQIEGKPVDGRADTYSLACLLYECLAGQVPFPRDSELAVLWAHVHEPPPRLAAYPALDPVIAKALAKDPEERYASCAELVEAMRNALGLGEVLVVRDRRPLVLAGLGAILAAGALAAGLVLSFGGGGPKVDLTVRNNTLVKIDPKTSRVSAVVGIGGGPRAVAVSGDTVWAYNTDDGTVSAVDSKTGAVERTASIRGSAPAGIITGAGPAIAADASGAWVISSDGSRGILTHVGTRPGYQPELTFDYDLASVVAGERALWVVVNKLGHSELLKIDSSSGAVRAKRSLPVTVTWLSTGDRAVWVDGFGVVGGAGTVFRIDPATMRITARAGLGPGSDWSMAAAGGGAVFVVDRENLRLVRFDARTLRMTGSVSQPGGDSGEVVLGGGALWWDGGTTGDVWRIDPQTERISAIPVTPPAGSGVQGTGGFHPTATAYGAGGLWVTVTRA